MEDACSGGRVLALVLLDVSPSSYLSSYELPDVGSSLTPMILVEVVLS